MEKFNFLTILCFELFAPRNSPYYKRKGSYFITSELVGFELSVQFFLELTAAILAKFTISLVDFEHSPGCEKFESQNLKKTEFLHSYFIFLTYLPREVDGGVISEIYF